MREILQGVTAGMGSTPLMRLTDRDAAKLVRSAFDGGLRTFHGETLEGAARIAAGLEGVPREEYRLVVTVRSADEFSGFLTALRVDCIDLALLDVDGGYEQSGLEELKSIGRMVGLGIRTRRLERAVRFARTGRFDGVAMPLNCLACDEELEAVSQISAEGLGIVALEPFAGGLWQSPEGALAFLRHLGAVPMFGVQYMWQLEQLLPVVQSPPVLDEDLWSRIHTERSKLAASYCRGCGECMPCPAGIDIPTAARMDRFMVCMDIQQLISAETERKMRLVKRCVGCGRCMEACRFHLPVRTMMRQNAEKYREFLREHGGLE